MQPQPAKDETPPNILPFGRAREPFASSTDQAAREPGPAIHDHELLRRIGHGAYGEVWLARNALGTCRAIKIVYRQDFEDSRPFEREFEGIQKFEPISRSHPGLVNILQVGRREDYFYYVMELADAAEDPKAETRDPKEARNPKSESVAADDQIPSSTKALPSAFDLRPSDLYRPRTLREDLRQTGRLPAERCVEIGIALTSALAHLHRHGLVHRDVKPSNIIFVQGAPKLADIGLVTEVGDSRSIVGTEGYLPPEGPGTPQADIFSLGKVLYEISTGQDRRKFPDLPPDLKEWPDREAVLELNEVVLRACAQDSTSRYASAEAMLADLEFLHRGKSVKRKRVLERGWLVCKKAGIGVALLGVLTVGTVLLLDRIGHTELHSAIPEVDELVARGNSCVLKVTPERLRQAQDYFDKALELDPKFAPAYVGLFRVHLAFQSGLAAPPSGADSKLRAAATNLIRIAPTLAEARIAESYLKILDGQFDDALAEAQLATKMPSVSREGRGLVHCLHGWELMRAGRPEDALQEYRLAERECPNDPTFQFHLGHPYFVQRKFAEALEQYQISLDLEPRQFHGYYCKGRVFEETGDFLRAIEAFEQGDLMVGKNEAETKLFYDDLRNAFQHGGSKGYWNKRLESARSASSPDPDYVASVLAHLGKMDEAYEWLDKACKEGKLPGLWSEVCWDHNDERFKAIAKKVGLRP